MERGKKTIYMVKVPGKGVERIDPEQSKLPIVPREHHLTFYAMMAIMTAGAIASWAFVTGTSIGVLIPANYGFCAALCGCTLPFAGLCVAAFTYNRYGTDMSVQGRSVWGHRGVFVMIIGLGFTSTYGWGSLPIIMLGRSTSYIMRNNGIDGFISSWQIWSIAALAIGLLITYRGTTVIDKLSSVTAPIVVALIIFICFVLAKDYGFVASFTTVPEGVSPDRATLLHNYMLSFEIACGVGYSWPFLLSAYTKPSMSENGAFTPSTFGSGVCWALCCIAPMITASMSGEADPVEALGRIGGGYAVIWMVMLIFANFSSCMVNPYFLSVSAHAMFPKLKWRSCVLIQCLYLVAILFPVFYDSFGAVISFIGMIEAPACIIWALDFLAFKRQNLRHCYAKGVANQKKSAYWYVAGFNPVTWGSIAVGATIGFIQYNPYSGAIRNQALFDVLGAMTMAAMIAVAVWLICYFAFYKKQRLDLNMRETVEEYAARKGIA